VNDFQPGKVMPADRNGRAVSGERRVITMLFCDVVGSTAMAGQLDPEEWAEIMNEAFDHLIAPIRRYEGTIARLQGDGFLAFFGAPLAHEDDPVRAVLAGLEILRDLAPFRAEIEADYGLAFNVRVGINTGPVVVGEIGADQALEYTAMGDAINLASRMETTASPGTVQIAESTYRLVAPLFEVEPLGEMNVKGKEAPVASYRVIGRKEQPGQLRGIQGLEAPMVGREEEMDRLRASLDALRAGKGQIVFLIGEAGLGKSRLLSEMASYWRQQPGSESRWTVAQGVPYETGRPYSLLYQRIRNSLGILEGLRPAQVHAQIEQSLASFPAEQKPAVSQVVEALLAIEGRSDGPKLEAEALKRQLFELTTRVWRNEALASPTVAVFDDLHWSDPASAELITHLLGLVTELPVMFLCAMRPDLESPGWQIRERAAESYPAHYSEFTLRPLDARHSDELVDHLLVMSKLPGDLRRLIQAKAEGNPFFLEEVVRTLIDEGAIVRDADGRQWYSVRPVDTLSIPENLQAMLISRIDRLDGQSKRTLQIASVIGRHFQRRVLAHLGANGQQLNDVLARLRRAELIVAADDQPEKAYMFRHELTREATYQTLLRRQRRRYHRRVGEVIESLYPERLNEEAHRLAYHFGQAGDKARALKYYELAGDQAARLYANKEAAAHYRQAIELSRDGGDSALLLRLYSALGKVLTFDGQFAQALASSQELEALALQMDDRNLALEAVAAQGALLVVRSVIYDGRRAQALLKKGLALAQELGNVAVEAKIQWCLMMANNNLGGSPEKGLEHGERSLALARAHNLPEQLAYTLHDLIRPLTMVGRLEQALSYSEEARRLFWEQNNMPMVVDNLATASSGYFLIGDLARSLERAEEALALSRQVGSAWGESYAHVRLTFPLAELGYVGQAVTSWQAAVNVPESRTFIGLDLYSSAFTALHLLSMGACEQGEAPLAKLAAECERAALEEDSRTLELTRSVQDLLSRGQALQYLCRGDPAAAAEALPSTFWGASANLIDTAASGLLAAVDGRVLLAAGDFERAQTLTRSRRLSLEQVGIKIGSPALLHIEAEALLAMGSRPEGMELLRMAAEAARTMSARRQLWPVLGRLAREAMTDGDDRGAAALRREAREVLDLMAADLDETWRRHFLALPEVRQAGGL
jgi:class 3 adenylate cyclase/tetratricopeptide (TPR) repeat protein